MPSVFEQPWTLLAAALVLFLGVGTWRAVFPEKNRWWQWGLPLAAVALALGLDAAVATDREQIRRLCRDLFRAAEAEDVPRLAGLLAPDYRDSLHRDTEAFLAHARAGLGHSPIRKLTRLSLAIDTLVPPRATVTLSALVVFEEGSQIASLYKAQFFTALRLTLVAEAGGLWRTQRIDLLEIDKQPMGWGQVPSQAW